MTKDLPSRLKRWLLPGIAAALVWSAGLVVPTSPAASADPTSAPRILKSMSDYMASQQQLSARFDVSLEVITPTIETLQFVGSGNLLLSRPNNLHVQRTGGYNDVQLFFDGETATIVDTDNRSYANLTTPGTVDQLINRLHEEFAIPMPGVDLLLTNSYEELMRDVQTSSHIGLGVVDGVECEHLAFRNADVDWQIWVRTGDRPLPCRYVITSKTVAGGPQYVVQFRDWATNPRIGSGAFTFTPPSGSTRVAFQDLVNIGELPSPAPFSQGDKR